MYKRIGLVCLLSLGLLLSACAARAAAPSYGGAREPVVVGLPAATMAPAAPAEKAYDGVVGSGGGLPTTTERLVVMNVSLSLVVADPTASVDQISALAASQGGFVVASYVYQASTDASGNKIMQATISIRVPAEKLNATLDQIKGKAVSVRSENKSGEDVTAQYTDLESRLRNLETAEKQLQTIMDGAVRTEDVLAVYNQLVSVRGEIEQVKGQMQYYSEAAAMSLVQIELIPDALNRPIEIGGWHPEGVAKDAIEALVKTLQGLANFLIWLSIYFLPLALICAIPIVVIVVIVLAVRRRAKKSKAEASKPAAK